jgi:carboxymethylenebutenolidase
VSVLKGEGRVPILFGSTTIVVGSRTHRGYLARPDLTGEWPTVVVVPGVYGLTSNVKDIARRIAREGFAAVAMDQYSGSGPRRSVDRAEAVEAAAGVSIDRLRRDIADIVDFIENPAGFWSSGEHGFGLLGLGWGGDAVVETAVREGAVCVGLVTTSLDEASLDTLAGYTGGVLGVFGREDGDATPEAVAELRRRVPHGEFVIYGGVGTEFLDDYALSYDFEVARDAIDRLAGFFEKHLPQAPS